ncbi:hypothetical protein MKW92_026116 [Papaver armeniacum]|nr:hypothetical protein MKW92_026116 [Papaver armeniacum]
MLLLLGSCIWLRVCFTRDILRLHAFGTCIGVNVLRSILLSRQVFLYFSRSFYLYTAYNELLSKKKSHSLPKPSLYCANARSSASSLLSHHNDQQHQQPIHEEPVQEPEAAESSSFTRDFDVLGASKLKGPEAGKWFSPRLIHDWYVYSRPSGKRCFVVSSAGTTVSRLRNGSILHRFPPALPNGHDQTYYVIDMVCWRGYSLYDCTAELFQIFAETGACDPPSTYHKYKFSVVPIYECDYVGLQTAYLGTVPYVRDGLSFYNKHAHYHTGNTPLALVWKDENCSQYVIDEDNDPPVVSGYLSQEFVLKSNLKPGNFLRFTVGDGGMSFVDGKLEKADLHYTNQAYRARASADSYSKILFQYAARHSPLGIEDLVASMDSSDGLAEEAKDVKMIG